MNDFKECINTANYIVEKITEKTGYKVALNKIKESTDPDDFYILYRMTINGQNYKLYAGDEDFTIAGEDNEIYIESDGFNTDRNIEYFCERIDGVNESMDFGEAKQILNENGYQLVENDIGIERNIKNLFTKNGWNLEETYERSGGVHLIFTRDGLEMDLFVKGFRYECDIFKGTTKIRTFANDFDNASEIVERVNLEL